MSTKTTAIDAKSETAAMASRRRLAAGLSLLRPHLPMLADVGLAFLISRLIFYTTAVIAMVTIPEYPGNDYQIWHPETHPLVGASWRWDAGWYATIVQEGYRWEPGYESSVAFFPLYPLLIWLPLQILPADQIWLVGVAVNQVLFFLALIAVWFYAVRFGGRPVAQRTVFLMAIFPAAFFFNAAYTEPVFLLTTAATLALLQRGRFALAGLAGFFGTLTRPPGVFLGAPYLIEAWRQHRGDRRGMLRAAVLGAPIPAALALWMGFLWWRFGNPLAFVQVQDAWDHFRAFPLYSVYLGFERTLTAPVYDVFVMMNTVNTLATVAALALAVVILRQQTAASVFVLLCLLAPLTLPTLGAPTVSMARYVAVLFPLFIPLAQWARTWSMQALLVALFLPTHVLLAALFVRWYWVV